jgi:hypothetical protein
MHVQVPASVLAMPSYLALGFSQKCLMYWAVLAGVRPATPAAGGQDSAELPRLRPAARVHRHEGTYLGFMGLGGPKPAYTGMKLFAWLLSAVALPAALLTSAVHAIEAPLSRACMLRSLFWCGACLRTWIFHPESANPPRKPWLRAAVPAEAV